MVVLNKIDIPEVAEQQERLMAELKDNMPHTRLLAISAAGRIGVADLMARTSSFLGKIKADEAEEKAALRKQRRDAAIAQGLGDIDNDQEDGEDACDDVCLGTLQDCSVTCLSESELLLSGAGAEHLLDEVKAYNSHYYGADQRLKAFVDAMNISSRAEESYREFRSKKGQQLCPSPSHESVGRERGSWYSQGWSGHRNIMEKVGCHEKDIKVIECNCNIFALIYVW